MKNLVCAVATIVALSGGHFTASALQASRVSAQSDTTLTADAFTRPSASRADVTSNTSCRMVEVAIDEGYGVSNHETRWECTPAP
ncbi:MAG: hypothetical protein WB816_05240 [Methylocystis sp.]